jgi:hypothetical protein
MVHCSVTEITNVLYEHNDSNNPYEHMNCQLPHLERDRNHSFQTTEAPGRCAILDRSLSRVGFHGCRLRWIP